MCPSRNPPCRPGVWLTRVDSSGYPLEVANEIRARPWRQVQRTRLEDDCPPRTQKRTITDPSCFLPLAFAVILLPSNIFNIIFLLSMRQGLLLVLIYNYYFLWERFIINYYKIILVFNIVRNKVSRN